MAVGQSDLRPLFASKSSVTIKAALVSSGVSWRSAGGHRTFLKWLLDSAAVFREPGTAVSARSRRIKSFSGGKCCKLQFLKVVMRSVYFWQFLCLLG